MTDHPPVMGLPGQPPVVAGASRRRVEARRGGGRWRGLLMEAVWDVEWTPAFIGVLAYVFTITTYFLGLGTLGAAVALLGLLLQKDRFRLPGFLRWFAAFLIWASFTLVLTEYETPWWAPMRPHEYLIGLGKLWLIAVVVVNGIRTRAQLRFFLLFFVTIFALFPLRGTLFNYFIYDHHYQGRAVWNGEFENPNQLAVLTILQVSIAAGIFLSERNRLYRWGALAVLLVGPVVILLTQSRGAFIGLAIFGLLMIARGRNKLKKAIAVLVIGTIVAMAAPRSVWERLGGLRYATSTYDLKEVDKEGSADERWRIWQTATKIIFDYPIIGTGFGTYPWANWKYERTLGPKDTHNTYLNVMAETGLIGIILFGGIVVSVIRSSSKAARRIRRLRPKVAAQILAMQVGLFGFLVAGIWGSYSTLSFLYVQLALLWVTSHIVTHQDPAPKGAKRISGRQRGR